MKANHVNPEEALQVALDLGSKKNYAMHWGTFQLTDEETLEPPALLEEALTKNGLPKAFFEILKPGQLKKVTLNQEMKYGLWLRKKSNGQMYRLA